MSSVVLKFNEHLEGNSPALRLLRHTKIDGAGHASFHNSLLLARDEIMLRVERRGDWRGVGELLRRRDGDSAAAAPVAVDVERRAAAEAGRQRREDAAAARAMAVLIRCVSADHVSAANQRPRVSPRSGIVDQIPIQLWADI
jgi:hypothetical protein